MPVRIVDIGLLGAGIEHDAAVPMQSGEQMLRFAWGGHSVTIASRCAHSDVISRGGQMVHRSGIEFLGASTESGVALRELIGMQVIRVLNEMRANARGERSVYDDDITPFLRSFSTEQQRERRQTQRFIAHHYRDDGSWRSAPTTTTLQPLDGFAIVESIREEELAMLKRTFEQADASGREMIRALAELSLSENDITVSPRSNG
jgi:hypothetical protein